MKNSMKFAALAAAALLGIMSCSKNYESSINAPWNVQEGTNCHMITLNVGGQQTKATSAAAEDAVSNVQIFIFNSDGKIENYYSGVEQTVTMRLSTGDKEARVLVNAPDYGSKAKTLTDLESQVTLFEENTKDRLVMVGSKAFNVSRDWTLTVDVSRIAAKVVLGEIDTEFSSPVYSQGQFVIKKIYLSNAPVDYKYFGTPVTTAYDYSGELAGDYDLNKTITGNASYTTSHTFYVYPNESSENPVRLVIYATLNGEPYYYPVNLGEIRGNTLYNVSKIVITRPGSDSEDDVIEGFEGDCSITVGDWDPDVQQISETI